MTELRFDSDGQGAKVFRVSQRPELGPDRLIGIICFTPEGPHYLESGNQFAAIHSWLWADELIQIGEYMKKYQCTLTRGEPAAV